MRWLGSLLLLPSLFVLLAAQPVLTFPPPKVNEPDAETLKLLEQRTEQLAGEIAALRKKGIVDTLLCDAEVVVKAIRYLMQHKEYYGNSAKEALAVLDEGLLRSSQFGRGEMPWLDQFGSTVIRGYRSRLDGSIQPYAVTYPANYIAKGSQAWRVDVVLHGRDPGLNEVRFLYRHLKAKPAPEDLNHVRIDIYGRGNNAYRWAGEVDVQEALENFLAVETGRGRAAALDPRRVVLRGFSMGGAGTWHIGLHRPDQFVVLGPGAGFTTTVGYLKGAEDLPEYQKKTLRIYDAVEYAENIFNVPVVAYSGEKDPQILAARAIESRLKPLGLLKHLTHLVAPDLGHTFPPEWQKKAEAEYARHVLVGRPLFPSKIRFVTHTLKYPSCNWVELMGLDAHYELARVEAERNDEGVKLQTRNVRLLRIGVLGGSPDKGSRETIRLQIDGQTLDRVRPYEALTGEQSVFLEKRGGKWYTAQPERLLVDRLRIPQKIPGLQGPIDDAFMTPFVCVRGTGKPWHEATEKYAQANLARFQAEWSKFFRGELPIKNDTDITPEDIATRNLILFGDPSSNSLIAEVLPRLPLEWSAREIRMAGTTYDASRHVPVLIYPSPLNAGRYVVLNSGHTFRGKDFEGTNALLYPRLGDHAILELKGDPADPLAVDTKSAGLFDEFWKVPERR